MKWKLGSLILLLVSVSLLPQPAVALDETPGQAIIHKTFTMYGGSKKDPYTIYYPFEITSPGEISVYVKAHDFDPQIKNKKFAPLRAVLVDARAFAKATPAQWKQWLQKANQYNPAEWLAGDQIRSFVTGIKHIFGHGKKKPPIYFHKQMACGRDNEYGASLKYAVDSPELAKTGGHYVLLFRNISPIKTSGTILIRYPGRTWEYDPVVEKYAAVHPDLTIKNISLNNKNQLTVEIKNRGKGAIMLGQYHQRGAEMVTLLVKVAGRSYGATLPLFDPERKLRRSGQSISYTFERIIISKATDVTVTIDGNNKLFETNEDNNSLTKKIGGLKVVTQMKPQKRAGVDLAIGRIFLNRDNEISVQIRNKGGAGLARSLWQNPQLAPTLRLKMDGAAWTEISLFGFDPDRNLAKAGSTTIYNTGFVPHHKVIITATIDSSNKVRESNENNNHKRQIFNP